MERAYSKATPSDRESPDIRVAAMRPSLEAVGRFDPARARSRFLERFDPETTYKIETVGAVVGLFVLEQLQDCVFLDHLYILPSEQGQGIGGEVVTFAKACAAENDLPVRLCALNGSKSNDFCLRNGFVVTGKDELDTYYDICQSNGTADLREA
ncbi:MAG: GNAT family N-acetyltransferase [Paracoccaceae bacterium]|jgi:GNAT superfamily N-acetyltransferase